MPLEGTLTQCCSKMWFWEEAQGSVSLATEALPVCNHATYCHSHWTATCLGPDQTYSSSSFPGSAYCTSRDSMISRKKQWNCFVFLKICRNCNITHLPWFWELSYKGRRQTFRFCPEDRFSWHMSEGDTETQYMHTFTHAHTNKSNGSKHNFFSYEPIDCLPCIVYSTLLIDITTTLLISLLL